jgi:hypothetical protein
MCQSPTESPDDEDDSYLAMSQRRTAEDRSTSPKSRRSGEWRSRDRWERPERDRKGSPEREEPPAFRMMASARAGSQRSSSRDRGSKDSQRDVNEGTINVLRSIQAKFMTMKGQTGKNSGYPFFDGTFK